MNPDEHLLSEQSRIENKSRFLIDNKQSLCKHAVLNPMTASKGRYIPVNAYIYMTDTFIKTGNLRVSWDLDDCPRSEERRKNP